MLSYGITSFYMQTGAFHPTRVANRNMGGKEKKMTRWMSR
jgi:hypothetical protein